MAGEGALHVRIDDGEITTLELEIYEPPRFFESFLRGRHFSEVPDIVPSAQSGPDAFIFSLPPSFIFTTPLRPRRRPEPHDFARAQELAGTRRGLAL